jgi:hypothetical protein
MQAIRETFDAGILSRIFTLPAAFVNRGIEIVMWPLEDTAASGSDSGSANSDHFIPSGV